MSEMLDYGHKVPVACNVAYRNVGNSYGSLSITASGSSRGRGIRGDYHDIPPIDYQITPPPPPETTVDYTLFLK